MSLRFPSPEETLHRFPRHVVPKRVKCGQRRKFFVARPEPVLVSLRESVMKLVVAIVLLADWPSRAVRK